MEKKSRQKVYTLLIQLGRKAGDGLPKNSTGGALLCYASGVDEGEAVREAVVVLKQADLCILEVEGHGDLASQKEEGRVTSEEETALMQRALDENSVIVAQMTPFYDN